MNYKFQEALQRVLLAEDVEVTNVGPVKKGSHDIYRLDCRIGKATRELYAKLSPIVRRRYINKRYDLGKEVQVLRQTKTDGLCVPNVLLFDPFKRLIPTEFFIMDALSGDLMFDLIMAEEDKTKLVSYLRSSAIVMKDIHSLDPTDYPFLGIDLDGKVIREMGSLQDVLEENINPRQSEIIKKSMKYLSSHVPDNRDLVVLNGDMSPSHLFHQGKDKWGVIDWDPTIIGDRSWDVFWMTKSGISDDGLFKVNNATDILVHEYEEATKKRLVNEEYYRTMSLAFAYILGLYIVHHQPEHNSKGYIEMKLGQMEDMLESRIKQ